MTVDIYGSPVMSAEVVKVIRVVVARGAGTVADPMRCVVQFWSIGEESALLAERDPCDPRVVGNPG